MGYQDDGNIGRKISNNIFYVLIGFIGAIIGIFTFVTNNQSMQDTIENWGNPGFIKNPHAEEGGIIWEAILYNNKELKEPVAFSGKIKGARNGLRVNWDVKSPNKKVNVDYFSGIFTATPTFNAGNYCFVVEVDDGARLFIDGEEVRNVWWGYTPGAVYKTPQLLSQGPHTIQFYYFDEYEEAAFHVSWYENPSVECVTVGHPGVP